MYDNLKAEMARAHVTTFNLSRELHISRQSVYSKLRNASYWNIKEMVIIQSYLKAMLPEREEKLTLDYLFNGDDE